MPTILTHVAIPLAIGLGVGSRVISSRLLLAGVVASMLPDLDVVAFRLHIAYADAFGHRGASHSIVFALCLALVAMLLAKPLNAKRLTAFLFIGISAASHGILDSFTNGGYGAALWWPFSDQRVFAPWQVIEVSPLSLQRVFSDRGIQVMQSELIWVWCPALLACAALFFLRHQRATSRFE